jgi:hypothetical protein
MLIRVLLELMYQRSKLELFETLPAAPAEKATLPTPVITETGDPPVALGKVKPEGESEL